MRPDGQTDRRRGCICKDFRKSNYKQANPKPKLTGQQKPQAILHILSKPTDTASLFLRLPYIKAKGSLTTTLLQSRASLALALQYPGPRGEKDRLICSY